jgi:hypothetical protein
MFSPGFAGSKVNSVVTAAAGGDSGGSTGFPANGLTFMVLFTCRGYVFAKISISLSNGLSN